MTTRRLSVDPTRVAAVERAATESLGASREAQARVNRLIGDRTSAHNAMREAEERMRQRRYSERDADEPEVRAFRKAKAAFEEAERALEIAKLDQDALAEVQQAAGNAFAGVQEITSKRNRS